MILFLLPLARFFYPGYAGIYTKIHNLNVLIWHNDKILDFLFAGEIYWGLKTVVPLFISIIQLLLDFTDKQVIFLLYLFSCTLM